MRQPDIEAEFASNTIEIPFPQSDLPIRSVDEKAAANLYGSPTLCPVRPQGNVQLHKSINAYSARQSPIISRVSLNKRLQTTALADCFNPYG